MEPCDEVLEAYQPFLSSQTTVGPTTTFPILEIELIQSLINRSITLLKQTETLVYVQSKPTIVIGDIHGNMASLIQILAKFSDFENANYVFLGDYVDRGSYSIPVMTLLLALFNKYPENITLLRGNHEFSHINQMYGFFDEIVLNYSDVSLWDSFQELFSWLPLAAIINSSILCVHGGISPNLLNIDQIQSLQRPIYDYENESLIADLVWSDPSDETQDFQKSFRGSGYLYGSEAVKSFLIQSNMKLLVRAHQCVADGYSLFAASMGVTVFSSSDYCAIIKNNSGVMKIFVRGKIEFYSFPAQSTLALQPRVTMVLNQERPGMHRSLKQGGLTLPQSRTPNLASAPNILPGRASKKKVTAPLASAAASSIGITIPRTRQKDQKIGGTPKRKMPTQYSRQIPLNCSRIF